MTNEENKLTEHIRKHKNKYCIKSKSSSLHRHNKLGSGSWYGVREKREELFASFIETTDFGKENPI